MSLEKGQKLGPYEIEVSAGAGGMGEVYRATDTRLGRTVALKVLPPQSAMNEDARARFEREAKTISSLNHPNICTLHDIGHENGVDFLVMELLEGELLADRLAKGKFDGAKVLEVGSQIAGALEAAHRKGVVHRDLKPGNIFLTREGAKLLDFGLAKLHAEAVTGLSDQTETTPVTGAGAIVGTLQYMSPEQLEGREADARSDIFSFGVTLYEMVTGQRAFSGTSKASLIGSIMKDEPRSITELQPTSPPALDRLIRKCLAKDPDDRWQSVKDLKDELDWIASAGSQAGIPAPVSSKRRFRMRLSWVLTILALCATVSMWMYINGQKHDVPETVRFRIPLAEGTISMQWPRLSPDGKMLALVTIDTLGVRRIRVRPMNSIDAYVLPGTEGVFHPFWSPDSKHLAFFADNQLKKVACTGGPVQIICDSKGEDGSWGKDGLILFDAAAIPGINGVNSSGGVIKQYTTVDTASGELDQGWPWLLPDGTHFLFHSMDREDWTSYTGGDWRLTLKLGSINSSMSQTLLEANSRVEYCDPGYLVYVKSNTLYAQPFDTDELVLKGEAIPLVSNLSAQFEEGGGFCTSNNGHLAYLTGGHGGGRKQGYLVRLKRDGTLMDTIGGLAIYGDATYSPDNSLVVYSSFREAGKSYDIALYDIKRRAEISVTRDQVNDAIPVWSPDGSTIAYTKQRAVGHYGVRLQSVREADVGHDLGIPDSMNVFPVQWTKENRLMLVEAVTTNLSRIPRTWLCPVSQPDSTMLLLSGPLRELPSGLSPDGRYLLEEVYTGREREVYLVDLQTNRARRKVSESIGSYPRWRSDGREVYYLSGKELMAVSVSSTRELQLGPPEKLFTLEMPPYWKDESGNYAYFGYDATSDGQEFVVIKAATHETTPAECEVVLNWLAAIESQK